MNAAPAIAAATLALAPLAAAETPLGAIERELRELSPERPLFELASAESRPAELRRLARALDSLEAELRRRLVRIDADPRLLTDPDLREERSKLAVRDLRLRLPVARARLLALDPDAGDASLRAALAALEPLDWAWGEPALDRSAAIAALRFRAGDFSAALAHARAASPADPLARDLRLAARAALGSLDPPPLAPGRLRLALAGAARHSPARAAGLARRALLEAPEAAIGPARDTALAMLAEIDPAGASPLGAIAGAARARDARTLARLADSPDPFLAAEANLALAELERPGDRLARALAQHPNPAARRAAAGRITAHLSALTEDRRLVTARALLADFPDHPHADRWRLELASVAPPGEALAALDRVADAELAGAAAALAARRAHDAFTADPTRSAAAALLTRVRAAGPAPDAWRPWLLRAETEARLALADPAGAAERILSAPPGVAAPAAALLAPKILTGALAAEAESDHAASRERADLAAELFALADDADQRALALALAGDPEAALAALARATGGPTADLARAEALFALDRDAEAFAIYRDIAGDAEARERFNGRFWRSWSRMLQIIARQSPSRAEEIAREIRRLRIIDADLGGDPHRRRFEALLDLDR